MTAGRPSAVLTPDQRNAVWSKAVPSGDTLAQANAAPYIVNFAQVDTDNDGTIDKKEFDILWEWPREKPTVIGSQTHVCLAAGHQTLKGVCSNETCGMESCRGSDFGPFVLWSRASEPTKYPALC